MRAERDASVERAVLDLLAEAGAPDVAVDARLRDDLGLDSLGVADLALAVEERLGVRLPEVEAGTVETVRDVVEAARMRVRSRPPVGAGFGRLQSFGKRAVGGTLRRYAGMEVVGTERVPAAGPAIVAPNHRSMFDIPALVIACPRPVLFMAKSELYRGPALRRLWWELGGFSVRRDVADLRALDTAAALLRRGEVVGVYPEGTRNRTGEDLLPFQGGAAWLALLTGAPIVPCGIRGTGMATPLYRRRQVRVVFGEPMAVAREDDPAVRAARRGPLMAELRRRVLELLD